MHQAERTFRRLAGMLLTVMAAVLLLSACGSNGNNGNGNASQATAGTSQLETGKEEQSTGGEETPQFRTVTDDLGREVEVSISPKAIIAGEFASELLTLGITPVGSGDNGFKVVFTQEQMKDVEKIGDPPNLEKILTLNPDLMIAPTVFFDIYPEQMAQIEKIAPIYYISFDQDPIYDIFVKIADLVGKSDEAAAWIKDYEAAAVDARARLKAAIGDETVSIFRVEKGRLRIYLNRNFAGYMLRSSLEANAPAPVAAELDKAPFGSAVEISLEKLPEYAGDHILLIVRGEGDDKAAFEEIEKSGLWNNLNAVKEGHVHMLETDKYYGSDIVTIRETMKEVLTMLTQ
ncbi:ABC transporter substrate-binding protein [Paenibacillus sp. HB172176]|uniref:ABC transporter substrate-binding protein n=1 Tax=Paenibacillus sp. HB172176 TaxID=2493690 RepID=UPI00143BEFB6|nr:ABC transporter substrate-binding protein [Paenibacillus sp. HB172176]